MEPPYSVAAGLSDNSAICFQPQREVASM